MMEVIYKEESYRIMGSCFEVYRELGCGFLEAVYQECLEIEFTSQGIPFVPQAELNLTYKDRGLKQKYFADLICMDKIIVEVKAVKELTDAHRAGSQLPEVDRPQACPSCQFRPLPDARARAHRPLILAFRDTASTKYRGSGPGRAYASQ